MRVLLSLAVLLLVASHQAQAKGGGGGGGFHGGLGVHGLGASRAAVPRVHRSIAGQHFRVNQPLADATRFARLQRFHPASNIRPAWGWGSWGLPYAWSPDYAA